MCPEGLPHSYLLLHLEFLHGEREAGRAERAEISHMQNCVYFFASIGGRFCLIHNDSVSILEGNFSALEAVPAYCGMLVTYK